MSNKVLVVYATKYGATEGIAQRIGKKIADTGFEVNVRTAEQVGDLAQYDAVILGSAVYAGQWRKEAADFLTQNEQSLSQKSVWLFSSGPTGKGDPVELMKGWSFPENLRAVAERIAPKEIAFFMGDLDLQKLNLPEKLIIKAMKAPTGDYRDWDAIDEWADTIINDISGNVQ
jgi:menaquinone-dependent protoporphyrinogen oxidase